MWRFFLCSFLVTGIACGYVKQGNATTIKCKKEAEAFAISESKKKGNLPGELLSVAHPTEMDGSYIVVYIGGWANYNYFKLKLGPECQPIKIEDVEYAR